MSADVEKFIISNLFKKAEESRKIQKITPYYMDEIPPISKNYNAVNHVHITNLAKIIAIRISFKTYKTGDKWQEFLKLTNCASLGRIVNEAVCNE